MNKTWKALAAIMLIGVLAVSCKKPKQPENGGNNTPTVTYEAVDLGLPSGTLWATFNVGATKPSEDGDFFAWGETQPKDTYTWRNYKYCKGADSLLTKYCDLGNYGYNGFTDHLRTLVASDDAATVQWGEDWCMPTYAQWKELIRECDRSYDFLDGKYGMTLTGPNQNKIFLPSAGYMGDETGEKASGLASYWSKDLSSVVIDTTAPMFQLVYPCTALYCEFATLLPTLMLDGNRKLGMSVRPVRKTN